MLKQTTQPKQEGVVVRKKKIWVKHDAYGCDSGCCGMYTYVDGTLDKFDFDHYIKAEGLTERQWIKKFLRSMYDLNKHEIVFSECDITCN